MSCEETASLRSPASLSPGSSSASPSSSSAAGGKSKCKRVRTIFTAEQLERLEAEFARQQYMVGPERLYLAAALNLTEAQVKVWFQNRRIKWRKQYIEQQHAKLSSRHSDDDAEKDLPYKDEEDVAKDHSRQTPSVLSLEEDLSVVMSHPASTTSSDLRRYPEEESKSDEDDDEEDDPRKPPSSEADVQASVSLIHKPHPSSSSTSPSITAPSPITTGLSSSRPYQVYLAAATLSSSSVPLKTPSKAPSPSAAFQKPQTEPTDLSSGVHSS